MTPPEPRAPWDALREIPVPTGMRDRVRERVEARVDRLAVRPPGRLRHAAPWLAVAIAAAVAAVVVGAVARGDRTAASGEPAASGETGASAKPRAIAAAVDERVELPLDHGHISVRGPAEVRVLGSDVELVHGTLDVLGQATINGPTCEARIDGTAEVSVHRTSLLVRRVAGSVEVHPRSLTCEVVELSPPPIEPPPPPPVPEVVRAPVRAAVRASRTPDRVPAPSVERPVDPPTDPLADAVAAYQAAAAREALEPGAAVVAWDAWLVRFPDNALAHTVEVRAIALLVRLDRRAEAAARARAFLVRYPDSPRRADIERVAGAAP